jgi:hypothetical protein
MRSRTFIITIPSKGSICLFRTIPFLFLSQFIGIFERKFVTVEAKYRFFMDQRFHSNLGSTIP